jgi:hypothetical protein
MTWHGNRMSETFITNYCDSDDKWGPLLFLRPSRHERFGTGRTLVVSALPGLCLGLLGSVLCAMVARFLGKPALPVYVFPLFLTVAYFVACQLIIVPSWNRRAARLSRWDASER